MANPTTIPAPGEAARFTTGATMRHVVVMAATGAVGLIAIFVVDLANLFYISLLGQKELAAAVGYSATIIFFAVSFCIGMTVAATAITAKSIGGGNQAKARTDAGASLIIVLAISLALTLLLFPLIGTLLTLLGARGETHAIAVHFMQITVPSIPFLALGMCSAGLLRAKGDAKRAMYVTLSAGIVAAGLDPLLIFTFDLGITGAALSNSLIRVLLMVVGFHGIFIVHDMVAMPTATELRARIRPFMGVGGPAVATQIATPVGNAYVTGAVTGFGDDAVAGWAIVGRIIPLAFAGIFALSGAIGPILAQNYGAGKIDRVSRAMRDSLIFTTLYVFAVWGLLAILKDPIVFAFSAEGDARSMIGTFCYLVAGMQIFLGFLFVANAAFNNLGHPMLSTLFNWGRATLGVIPFVYLAESYGPAGMIAGWALSGVVFGIAAVIVCFKVLRKLPAQAAREGITVQVPAIAHSPFSSGRGAGIG